jgi:hypothetical protein
MRTYRGSKLRGRGARRKSEISQIKLTKPGWRRVRGRRPLFWRSKPGSES